MPSLIRCRHENQLTSLVGPHRDLPAEIVRLTSADCALDLDQILIELWREHAILSARILELEHVNRSSTENLPGYDSPDSGMGLARMSGRKAARVTFSLA